MELSADENAIFFAVFTAALAASLIRRRRRRRRKPRAVWSRNWLLQRDVGRSTLSFIDEEIKDEDPETFRNYFRMSDAVFNKLLALVEHKIKKQDTVMRESISARRRLQITLRYLATGESFKSLSTIVLCHHVTVGIIVKETLEAIKSELLPLYLKAPSTREEWEAISNEFYTRWGFPNCCGAMDGKHIGFRPLRKDGATYYNYKKFHSIVLLAIVDANRKFLIVDLGTNGRISDGGVLDRSQINTALIDNTLNFPPPKPLPGRYFPVPHVIVADNAFPLRKNIMKPYTMKGLSVLQEKYNKSLSRARNVVENAFGILASRFRVFLGLIESSDPAFVELVGYAGCILHNFLMEETNGKYAAVPRNNESTDILELVPLEPVPTYLQAGTGVRLEFLRWANEIRSLLL